MKKRIAVADVRLGMFIQEFEGAWINHPFMRNRFLLQTLADLNKIKASKIEALWIDVSKGLDVEVQDIAPAVTLAPAIVAEVDDEIPTSNVSLEREVARAAQLCARSKQAVMEMFHDARMGKAVQLEQAGELVSEISASVLRHPNALISLARLKNADEYTYMHSVAVCALMIALARELQLEETVVKDAGLAGLLHDIGKMAVDDKILNKPGKLTDAEFVAVQRHPEAGFAILKNIKQVSETAKDVCLHHHEKYDGSGYPHKLSGEGIHLLARMGAVCDVYDAITSDRPYKKGWDPAEAIRKMAEWKGHFDTRVFQAFVKAMGIYPTGALVRLQSGKLAVVLEQNKDSLLTPVVKIFFSAKSKVPIAQEVIDLSKHKDKDKIIGREPLADWNFPNLDELWSGLPRPIW